MLLGIGLSHLLAVNNIYLSCISVSAWTSLKDPWEEGASNHTLRPLEPSGKDPCSKGVSIWLSPANMQQICMVVVSYLETPTYNRQDSSHALQSVLHSLLCLSRAQSSLTADKHTVSLLL